MTLKDHVWLKTGLCVNAVEFTQSSLRLKGIRIQGTVHAFKILRYLNVAE